MRMLSYKPLEITLIRRDKTKKDLREDLGLSPSTIAKIGRGDPIALSVIVKLCEYLDCDVQDVIEVIKKPAD